MPHLHAELVFGRCVQQNVHPDQLLLSVFVRKLRDQDIPTLSVRGWLQKRDFHLLLLPQYFKDRDCGPVCWQQTPVQKVSRF